MRKSTDRGRILSLDIVRIVAIFTVLMIHASMNFVKLDAGTAGFVQGSIFDSLSRIGVPLFIMTSGALMLDENRRLTSHKLFKGNIGGIALIYIFWSVLYCVAELAMSRLDGEAFGGREIIKNIIYGPTHLWYLFMTVGLYLITPILRKFVKKENKSVVLYFIALSLIFHFTQPVINLLGEYYAGFDGAKKFLDKFYPQFLCGFTTYYLTGWYIFNNGIEKKRSRIILYALSLVSLIGIILYVIMAGSCEHIYENNGLPVYFYSVGVFIFICHHFKGRLHNNRVVKSLSALSFGVYLVHIGILTVLDRIVPVFDPYAVYVLVKFAAVSALSYFFCFIASKIPIVRKCIRM